MVSEVLPAYYAAGEYTYEFEILGRGFDSLPNDIVGVPMVSNDNPLQFRNATSGVSMMTIAERSNNRLVMRAATPYNHEAASIGALLSNDRTIVYWVNDTNPIP